MSGGAGVSFVPMKIKWILAVLLAAPLFGMGIMAKAAAPSVVPLPQTLRDAIEAYKRRTTID